jgi:hypothetical protein
MKHGNKLRRRDVKSKKMIITPFGIAHSFVIHPVAFVEVIYYRIICVNDYSESKRDLIIFEATMLIRHRLEEHGKVWKTSAMTVIALNNIRIRLF